MGSLKVVVSQRPCLFFSLVIFFSCIWIARNSKKEIKRLLQDAIEKSWSFQKMNFKINKTKTCHTTFTRAGARSNYERKYKLNIKIEQKEVPLEQNPTFLGIKLDPKLAYSAHLQDVIKKQMSKMNLISKIKSFKWSSSLIINLPSMRL